jgi:hypothetical protein
VSNREFHALGRFLRRNLIHTEPGRWHFDAVIELQNRPFSVMLFPFLLVQRPLAVGHSSELFGVASALHFNAGSRVVYLTKIIRRQFQMRVIN